MKKFIIIFLLLFGLGIFFWQGIYLSKGSTLTEEKTFLVEKGQSLFQIAENLEKEGLIKNQFLFNFYVFLKGQQNKLQAGEYSLSPSMDIAEVAKKIISGDIAKEKITIIEGWNLKDIGFYFENKGMFQAEELYDEMPELEGYLFPDTYWIRRGASLEEIVEKMKTNFQEKTKGLEITPEIVIMASLIEKEVKTKEDKELVSGILWKRLEDKMPLQVDATITYITGKRTTKISKEETQIDSPYNTYKYLGLPIGPICNPGLESILAALYPKDSECWYYLSSPEGKTYFSKTLEEHNIKKAKYLKPMPKVVEIIAFKDFRDEEYFVPKEILETAGAEVKTASNQMGTAIGADGGELEVDLLVSEINPADFDAIVFIGGPGCLENLDNENSYKVAKDTVSQNKILASICISPTILAKAGVLKGKKATVWTSPMDKSAARILEDNGAIYQDKDVVVDGKIITGNGPGAAEEFGQAIVKALTKD